MGKSRVGYRLTEDAEYLISRYEDEECSCSTCGSPPCNRCEDSCPRDVAEDVDEFWEIDPDYEEEEEMTEPYLFKKGDVVERINTNAYQCSVGRQYSVSRDQTESTRDRLHIINDAGESDFWCVTNFKLIRKAGATPPHKFKVGDKVRVIGNRNKHNRKIGDICYLIERNIDQNSWKSSSIKGGEHEFSCHMHEKDIELVQPEVDKEDEKEDNGSVLRYRAHGSVGTTIIAKARPIVQNNLCSEITYDTQMKLEGSPLQAAYYDWKLKQEDKTMTQLATRLRRVLNIQLLDNDPGLPVEHALVAKFEEVVTEDTDEVTIQELISTGEVAKHIEAHNKVRTEQTNLEIQNRTGNTVKLLPIKLKNLTWNIK